MTKRILEGVRILDATISWAGPQCMTLLAGMGAEIIKVESFTHLDLGRGGPTIARPAPAPRFPDHDPGEDWWNRNAIFNFVARGRYDLALALDHPLGREVYRRLAAVCDVVAESYRIRVMRQFGLTYADLLPLNPDLIMISLPLFGATGPYSEGGGLGYVTDAFAGHTLLRSYADAEPYTYVYGDPVAGATAAFAVLAALHHRQTSGQGQYIDLAQTEAAALRLGEYILDYDLNGRLHQPIGNRHATMAPHGCYPCSGNDQWVVLTCRTDEEFGALCRAMGQPGLATDERFADPLNRYAWQDELDALIATWTQPQESRAVAALLQAAGIPAGPVLGYQGLYEDPHLHDRGFWTEATHPSAGTHTYPGMYFKMSKTPAEFTMPAPRLGEHNDYVLREILGMTAEEVADLAKAGVISDRPIADD